MDKLNKPANVTPSEQLRLNMSIAPSGSPKRLGVLEGDTAGFPNGRRLTDDVIDITLQAAMGELVGSPNDLGDGVNVNDVAFATSFPYVALPHSGSSTEPRGTRLVVAAAAPASGGGASTPRGGVQTGAGGSASSLPMLPVGLLLAGLGLGAGALLPRRRKVATTIQSETTPSETR